MNENNQNSTESKFQSINITELTRLTLGQFLSLVRKFSLGSWILCLSIVCGFAGGMFAFGYSYSAGNLPALFYPPVISEGKSYIENTHDGVDEENKEEFIKFYSDFTDWGTLQTLARGILEDKPDGLNTVDEIIVSLLYQVKSSGGMATFLMEETELTMQVFVIEDGFSFEWERKPSFIRRIFEDAGYSPNLEDIRNANSHLNKDGIFYIDERKKKVIYRDSDGSLGLVLRDQSDN